ncbi:SPOR domain-containing protein [Microvirga antarctica]|uniref:SPOR domain-containing protein n=1 Tax=Microvirga antarctica TaxID=2819233 RepID=UPI001B3156D5|nr:SPOR domain-containing protein [Microvirga antarctica]
MSGTQKPHFAVDLNEIERQLAQAQSGAPAPSVGHRHDPLADLARIGGQDDPFASLLSNEPSRSRGGAQASHDQLFAVRGDVAPAAAFDPYGRREPTGYDYEDDAHHAQHAAATRALPDGYAYQQPAAVDPAACDPQAYDQGGYAQDYYDGQAAPQAASYDEAAYAPPPRGRSRKAALALGAVLGVVVIGGAGAFVLGGRSSAVSSGEPPLIAASNEPIKVAPQNPGGVEIPNQNKQIYERAQSGETKVVSNSEQPVDVKQTVRMNGGAVAESTGSAGPAHPPAAPGLNLGEPKKVRTIAIRPDGTLARQDTEAKAPVAAPAAMTMPAGAAPPAAPRAAATTPAAKPVAVASAETPAAAPQRVASIQPTAPAATAGATTSEASVSGFSVQLAVRGTEKEAQSAFSQFQKKYPELAGQVAMIRKAEVNGNTVFRVRAGPMSRDDASSLCSSVQGQGGQCFVAKN